VIKVVNRRHGHLSILEQKVVDDIGGTRAQMSMPGIHSSSHICYLTWNSKTVILVEEVEELERKRAELVEELPIKVAEEDDRNANLGNGRNGCSYKEFVACKPKEFDGKGGVVAYIRWVKKMEAVQDISGCGDNQKVKYSTGSLTAYTDQFHELARLVPHLIIPETKRIKRYIYGLALQIREMVVAIEPPTIQNVILKVEVLTDETVRNGSLEMTGERRGYDGITPPRLHNAAEYHFGVLLHSPYAQVTENDLKRDV
nr:reverse transcriptase domain-containing protein [Tanacetum cinerariifolium]